MPKKRRLKLKNATHKSLLARAIIYSLISVGTIFSIAFVPKQIFTDNFIHTYCVNNAIVESKDDISLYDYEVYSTEKRFNSGIENDIPKMVAKFKDEGRVLLVKLPGEPELVKNNDYLLQKDLNVPKFNIEYYVVKTMNAFGNILPIDTVIPAARHIGGIIDQVYLGILITVHILLLFGFTWSDYFIIKELAQRKKDS